MQERIYTPDPALSRPGVLFREMWKDVLGSRELAYRLAIRDIKAQYRLSKLGYVWAFIPPVATSLAFIMLRSGGVFEMSDTAMPYAAFVLIGTVLWQTFVDAMNSPIRTAAASAAMIVKVNFPREAILLSGLLVTLFNTLVRLSILIPVLFYYRLPLTWGVVMFVLAISLLILLGWCFGILLTPVGMLYKDVQQSLAVITGFWMFLTPVVFPMKHDGLVGRLMRLNPVSYPILVARTSLSDGSVEGTLGMFVVGFTTLVLLMIGWLLYRLALPHVISRLGM